MIKVSQGISATVTEGKKADGVAFSFPSNQLKRNHIEFWGLINETEYREFILEMVLHRSPDFRVRN